jgi:hypothetical protein
VLRRELVFGHFQISYWSRYDIVSQALATGMRRRKFITLFGGAVAAWPLLARAQRTMSVIGLIGAGSVEGYAEQIAAFRIGLGETGFIERQNVLRIPLGG